MNDCKVKLIADVTEALADKLDHKDVNTVSDEMALALRDYEVTKAVTDIVQYDGFNENIQKRYRACLIIAGRSPKTIEQYDRMVRKLSEAVQKNYLDMTASDLRYFLALEKNRGVSNRTLASTLVSRGMGIQEISKLLGHTNINTTMTYVYTSNAQVQASYAKYATL